ncbi:hypothetical protein, partial [Streptomyces buecherae]|uniref:hypothetical protein n=1 Tax=Streptomyces buecherae TaxID=2763006 RepID=UPI0020B88434
KGDVSLLDIHHADLVLTVGQNPGSNHPRMLSALGLLQRGGGQIVAVNPLPEADLEELVGDVGAPTDHAPGLLRVLEPHQARL